MVDTVPLEVVVVLDVDVSVDNRLADVEAEEQWHKREHQSGEISGQTYVNVSISFV